MVGYHVPMNFVSGLAHDVRFATRLLLNERWFTVAAVLSLALAIGVVNMVVTVLNGYYFTGLPGPDRDRIAYVGTHDANGRGGGPMSYIEYQQLRSATRSFESLAAFANANLTLGVQGQAPDRLGGVYISAHAFEILGERATRGRVLLAGDERPGAPPVIVISHRLWTHEHNADPAIIGRSLILNGIPTTVVGVMREDFEFPFWHAAWLPLTQMPDLIAQPHARQLGVLGRLADGVSLPQARAELHAIAASHAQENRDAKERVTFTAMRFGEQQVGRFGSDPGPMMGAAIAIFVLLIACANVASLLLARAAGRTREIAVRTAQGATRARIVRQLLVESVILAFAGGAVGLWLSLFAVRFISQAFGRNVPYWMELTVDARVLTLLVATCCVTSILFGLAPALFASNADVNGLLKEGGRAGVAPRARRVTNALLVAELAITVVLLTGAGLMTRSFIAVYEADTVVDASKVLTTLLALRPAKYTSEEQRVAGYMKLDEHLAATLPTATVASGRPFAGGTPRQLTIDSQPANDQPRRIATVAIASRYFDVLGVSLVRGRGFTARDGMPGEETVIVNQRFVDVYFAGRNPIGERIRLTPEKVHPATTPWLTIVGVSPSIRQAVAAGANPVAYVPLRSHSALNAAIIIGHVSNTAAMLRALRTEVAAVDADTELFNVRPLSELLDDSRLQPKLFGVMTLLFGTIALILSTVGLYALTAYAVLQRRHEIGVRMALGARAQQVVWLLVRRGMVPLALGLALGLAGAFGLGQLIRGALIHTTPTDPVTFTVVVFVLVTVAFAACFFPGRRAARVDPVASLRAE